MASSPAATLVSGFTSFLPQVSLWHASATHPLRISASTMILLSSQPRSEKAEALTRNRHTRC